MTLFFDYKVNTPEKLDISCSAWHEQHHILAIGAKDGSVSSYSAEGECCERLEDVKIKRTEQVPCVLCWHKVNKCLFVGWGDGVISVWSDSEKQHKEFSSGNGKATNFLMWAGNGKMLVSSGEGTITLWKNKKKTGLQLVKEHKVSGVITCGVSPSQERENSRCPWFICGVSGKIWSLNENGSFNELISMNAPIAGIFYDANRDHVTVLTSPPTPTLAILRPGIAPGSLEHSLPPQKLDIQAPDSLIAWVGNTIASAEGAILRVWMDGKGVSLPSKDIGRYTSLEYNSRSSTLISGATNGKLYMWQNSSQGRWEQASELDSGGVVSQILCGPDGLLACIHSDSQPTILAATILHQAMSAHVAALQIAPDRILLEKHQGASTTLQTGVRIKGMFLHNNQLAVWNGHKVEIFQIKEAPNNPTAVAGQLVGSFNTTSTSIVVHGENVFTCIGSRLEACSFKGIPKQSLSFSEAEGEPHVMDLSGEYLGIATRNNVVRIYDVSRREARIHGSDRRFEATRDGFSSIFSLKINANGTLVCLLVGNKGGSTAISKIIIYAVERDVTFLYDFEPIGQYVCISFLNAHAMTLVQPVEHFWDVSDARLLVSATKYLPGFRQQLPEEQKSVMLISTIFATSEHAPVLQDQFPLPATAEKLLGIDAPYIFYRSKRLGTDASMLKYKVLRDFTGMDTVDDSTKHAMLDFGYFVALGKMDEAYKSVAKLVKNASVWVHLARMSIQTRRLDVLSVCLGNMGHASAARALRNSLSEEPDQPLIAVAVTAIHLGLFEEAEKIFAELTRHDLINTIYQATGRWQRALEIAGLSDRIHLRTTHFSYAKHLETLGDIAGAIAAYETAQAHRTEVPRMLLALGAVSDLETYIDSARDKALYAWRAKYCESKSMWEKAIHYYELAGDYLSLIRIRCFQGKFAEAKIIAIESKDKAASYHLARQCENDGNIKEALQFYSRAECFNHGIRLAIEHQLDADLMNLALLSGSPRLMVQAARHFEEGEKQLDKAVLLYHKGGAFNRAVDLCIQGRLYEHLENVMRELDAQKDPVLLGRCATFFLDNKQYERAAHLVVLAGDGNRAIELCMQHNIPISEEMADQIAPPLKQDETPEEAGPKVAMLRLVAKCCKRQGAYHLATKKYTQAKDKLKAMKVLLKSGDTEKIIFFAGVSRQREIYILAANYLQTLNWRSDPEIMKQIIAFYTKAKVPESLALFYEACAQVEIDEYQNYEKALGALREAQRHLSKARLSDLDARLNVLNNRIYYVERFAQARKLFGTSPDEAVSAFRQLLESPDINTSVRVGDICSQLVAYYYSKGSWDEAFRFVDRLVKLRVDVFFFVDERMVRDIYKRLGINFDFEAHAEHGGIDEDIHHD